MRLDLLGSVASAVFSGFLHDTARGQRTLKHHRAGPEIALPSGQARFRQIEVTLDVP